MVIYVSQYLAEMNVFDIYTMYLRQTAVGMACCTGMHGASNFESALYGRPTYLTISYCYGKPTLINLSFWWKEKHIGHTLRQRENVENF